MSTDTSGAGDLEGRLNRLVAILEPAAEASGQSRVTLSPGYSVATADAGAILTVARLCLRAAQESDRSTGLLGRLMSSRSARRRHYLRNGAAAGALLIEAALYRLGYYPFDEPLGSSRTEGQAMLDLLKPVLAQAGSVTPGVLRLAARVEVLPHSPWGGQEYDIYLAREDLTDGLCFSITGPRGRSVAINKEDAPEFILRDAGGEKVEKTGGLQFDVIGAAEGVNLLYHDEATLSQLRDGKTPDAVGQATFGHARLARGQAAFRMTQMAGHTIEQPLIPHQVRIHYQSTDGAWSR